MLKRSILFQRGVAGLVSEAYPGRLAAGWSRQGELWMIGGVLARRAAVVDGLWTAWQAQAADARKRPGRIVRGAPRSAEWRLTAFSGGAIVDREFSKESL
jgi:hypothetical protein